METVRMISAPSRTLASSSSVAVSKAATGVAPGGRISPAAHGNRGPAVPGSTNVQSSQLDAFDFGDLPIARLSLGDAVPGFPAGSFLDDGSPPDSLDAFQSMLDAAPAEANARDNKGDLVGVMPWGTMHNAGIRSAGRTDFSAPDGGRFGDGLGVDEASVEHFSISHPVWGQLDVDSRRSPSSWDVVVRCAERDTQQRLQSRESEFRNLLQREYGVSLALDVQVGRSR